MKPRKLTPIYSVGEGRTIVLASDACVVCIKAFSTLLESLPRLVEEAEEDASAGALDTTLDFSSERLPSSPPRRGGAHRRRGALQSEAAAAADVLGAGNPKKALAVPGARSVPNPRNVKAKKEAEEREGDCLLVFDPASCEEEGKDDHLVHLSLQSSDRLILAMLHPPADGILEGILDRYSSDSPEPATPILVPSLSLNSRLAASASSRSSLASPGGSERGVMRIFRSWRNHKNDSATSPLSKSDSPTSSPKEGETERPKKKAQPVGPKLGPGSTCIFTPLAEWEEVEKGLESLDVAHGRDGLKVMVQLARKHKFRFEAVKMDQEVDSEGILSTVVDSLSLHTNKKQHSAAAGKSLVAFCDRVEAKLLLLGTAHASPAEDTKPQSFYSQLLDHCKEHSPSILRVFSSDQFCAQGTRKVGRKSLEKVDAHRRNPRGVGSKSQKGASLASISDE